ncbi:hypothetical protein SDC9_143666 [bioreactor metagenome]|uniref:Uncharacterized protein n=1 Tax=bioreactor metagenome TaxID=1076179 RepID=A0A645E7C9_9ZZZZ
MRQAAEGRQLPLDLAEQLDRAVRHRPVGALVDDEPEPHHLASEGRGQPGPARPGRAQDDRVVHPERRCGDHPGQGHRRFVEPVERDAHFHVDLRCRDAVAEDLHQITGGVRVVEEPPDRTLRGRIVVMLAGVVAEPGPGGLEDGVEVRVRRVGVRCGGSVGHPVRSLRSLQVRRSGRVR